MLKGHVFSSQIFENQIFALFINTFLDGADGISGNYKNSMSMTYSGSTITVNTGAVCIQGRFLEESETTEIDVGTSTGYGSLVIEIDLDETNTTSSLNQAYYKVLTSTSGYPSLTQTDIVKNNSGIYQYELARFKITSSGISSFTDRRTYLDFDSIYTYIKENYEALMTEQEEEFTEWFENLQTTLSDDVAGNLQVEIEENSDAIVENTTAIENLQSELENYLPLSGGTVTGTTTFNENITAKSGVIIKNAGLELHGTNPYIDFHYNSSSADYTSRIWESSSGRLEITGKLIVDGDLTVDGIIFGKDIYTQNTAYCVMGYDTSHSYTLYWYNEMLNFFVDATNVGNVSDKRLKTDFAEIDDKFLNAIEELEIQQFKINNRNGLISFGIIAQDLIKVFEKYEINPNDYEILGKVKYDLDDDTEYYKIEYTQFLILKQKAQDRKIEKLQNQLNKQEEEIAELRDIINELKKA